jgi:hypothetical protein
VVSVGDAATGIPDVDAQTSRLLIGQAFEGEQPAEFVDITLV